MSAHEAQYEWDSSYTAVECRCGFYRIAENRDVAEAEYTNHLHFAGVGEEADSHE